MGVGVARSRFVLIVGLCNCCALIMNRRVIMTLLYILYECAFDLIIAHIFIVIIYRCERELWCTVSYLQIFRNFNEASMCIYNYNKVSFVFDVEKSANNYL